MVDATYGAKDFAPESVQIINDTKNDKVFPRGATDLMDNSRCLCNKASESVEC